MEHVKSFYRNFGDADSKLLQGDDIETTVPETLPDEIIEAYGLDVEEFLEYTIKGSHIIDDFI